MVNHTFYVKVGDEIKYKEFQKVCDREGKSVSEKLMIMIYNYMASHGEGNPQTILDHAGKHKTLPNWKTCKFSQGLRVKGEIFCQPVRKRGYYPNWKPTTTCDRCEIFTPEM